MWYALFLAVLLAFLPLVPVPAAAALWNIDPDHSNLQFKISHLGLAQVVGTFTRFQGTVELEEANPAKANVKVTIEAASIHTGVEKRDEHLRSPDFFDVAQFPTITFVSREVTPAGPGKLKVAGDLTMHGVTQPVVLEVNGPTPPLQDPWGKIRRGASATTSLKREDFGITYNKILPSGVPVIGSQVTIHLELELLQAPAAGAP